MGTRKPISKKIRFDVFKRDGFTCQYCGNSPPSVVLEIDHIEPICKGGIDDIDNLITACFGCNRGKAGKSLDSVPASIVDKSRELKEKEEQIVEYKKLIQRKKRRQDAEIREIVDIFAEVGQLTKIDRTTIRNQFLPHLMADEMESAMLKAVIKCGNDPNRTWKYFCGICWRTIERKQK